MVNWSGADVSSVDAGPLILVCKSVNIDYTISNSKFEWLLFVCDPMQCIAVGKLDGDQMGA